jgi:hypothetical protein
MHPKCSAHDAALTLNVGAPGDVNSITRAAQRGRSSVYRHQHEAVGLCTVPAQAVRHQSFIFNDYNQRKLDIELKQRL